MEIRGSTISESSHKKKQNDTKEAKPESDILKLEQNKAEDLQELEKLRLEMIEIRQTKVKICKTN